MSGFDGGIIASGKILCNPEIREPAKKDPFYRDKTLERESYLAVDVEIQHKLTKSIVPRTVLLADERTKGLQVLTYPSATNFRVSRVQEEVIESIIGHTYKRVPSLELSTAEPEDKKRYWIYSPGANADHWEEFNQKGMMAIGWDELGDLEEYTSKEGIKIAMQEILGEDRTYKNDGLALWQFYHDMSLGDIVYAKRGKHTVVGRGVVESDYIFDPSREIYKHVRKIRWTNCGEWEHPGQAVQKTLTDITAYTEYVEELEIRLTEEIPDFQIQEKEIQYPEYVEADFLREVYLSEERYHTLEGLLLRKKNVILQGAPGVGKTFVAQRLAFSMMGVKDISRVKVVQFHQSYSYEDFIMGYRPDGNGFTLAKGPFYKFCKEAEMDDRLHFFIIDEINRGNLSKIFGELLMLIENDKRGEKHAIRLLYSDEQFYVPKNVHIIGMMNTADRSLAMMDYALRRRFAFFGVEPAFASEGFREEQRKRQSDKFDRLIEIVEILNKEIEEDTSLGAGFKIGHSYFCTTEIVDNVWLSDLVEYELLPLLQEYWFDESDKIERWVRKLRGVLRGGSY